MTTSDGSNLTSPSDGPINVFGTLTTLVQRSKTEDPSFDGLQLLVLEASGLAVYPLPDDGSMSIGRAEECDVQLRDPLASRRHATLHVRPLVIEDRGSANGTLVGSRVIEPGSSTSVQLGQAIAIGGALLIVRRSGHEKCGKCDSEAQAIRYGDEAVIVRDPAMAKLHALVERIASGPINVLVLGETGVGKDVMAEAIHRKSPRREAALVRINCAALSETLLESELFGHERGAFTGAVSAKPGLIEVGNGGTVFLDEVGELSATLQAKLLRVIEARELTRVGGLRPRPVDVRFIAATNRDLQGSVARGDFRADLFYRLNGASILIPPLRDRSSEILPLAEMILARTTARMGQSTPPRLSLTAQDALLRHPWPGNIRELRNVVERAALLCSDGRIGPEDLALTPVPPPSSALSASSSTTLPPPANSPAVHAQNDPAPAGEEDERTRIIRALEACNGNQTRAAKLLAMPRRTLVAKLPRYSIPRPRKLDPS
jgi:transcriptional regulator with GAF, ATPase, and Fis domain